MITTALLNIIYYFIVGITYPIRLLSDVSLPGDLSNAIQTASGYLSSINNFIPAGTLLIILANIIVIETFILLYKLIMWVIRKIPTIS